MQLATGSKRAHVGQRVAFGLPVAIWMMLVNAFVMNVGFYMLIPLVSVHYTSVLGFSAASVGAALAVRQFSQQGMMIATGTLAERIGYRPVLVTGMLVRSLGFAAFALADDLGMLIAASFVAALGGAFFEVSCRSLMAVLVPAERRADGFALWSLTSNVGLAVGPVLGALLIRTGFASVCLVAASVYFVGSAGTRILVPPTGGQEPASTPAPGLRRTVGIVTADRRYVLFVALLSGYYLLGAQLFITVPLQTERLTGSTDSLGIIYLVHSLVSIAVQFPLIRVVGRRVSRMHVIAGGTAILGTSLTMMGLAHGLLLLIACASGIAVGRVLIEPTVNVSIAAVASRAGAGLLASYYGFSALSVAVGGSTGQLLGGWLFDQSELRGMPGLPFVVIGVISATVTVAIVAYSRSEGGRRINRA